VNQSAITPEIARFIAEQITSADQLDILLLLHGDPAKLWKAEDVSRAVFTVPTAATMRLEDLARRGFLMSSGGADPSYRYQPASDGIRRQVDALAAAYRTNRVAVINLVFQRRPDPLKSFSDAFRVRPE
jgi:hypothetical protein